MAEYTFNSATAFEAVEIAAMEENMPAEAVLQFGHGV